ncbi:unnamed protein product [Rotaria sordida]|uniref:NAD(P)(+)--arginine ADP-ribosyltransferase n=1 Tax=Rotaria sordida TaxID=392033 RepID=A0A819W270_9BILA|nr:unnamed protein product [Rotaria sordida]CAF1482770.1 unnamed protein product [Rotaria sordida]CAF4069584.1 unnamed protein product [Rotaria sordida]CAF4117820.1 unnamed protein product [Rotaria sordida]
MNRFGDIDVSFKRLPVVYGYRSQKLVPIEKALEPIEPQIDNLPYWIKIAKRSCHFPSEHGLSRDQSAAIYIYTMEWGEATLYRTLNKALRSENRQGLKIWFLYLKLFDTALDKLPTVKEVVWRGIPLDIGKNFTENQIVTWWSINSCSSSVNVIKNFLGNDKNSTLFLIEAVNGKKISGYTEYENENEIILQMGSQFRVKSDPLDQSNGSHLVHLIEIDDNDDHPLASAMNEMRPVVKSSNTSTLGKIKSPSCPVSYSKNISDISKITENDSSDDDILYSMNSDISDIGSDDVGEDSVNCESDVFCESADDEGVTKKMRQYESWLRKKLKSNLPFYDGELK